MALDRRLPNPVRIIGPVEHAVGKAFHKWSDIEHRRNVEMHAQLQKAHGRKGPTVDRFGLAVPPIALKTKPSSRKRKPKV